MPGFSLPLPKPPKTWYSTDMKKRYSLFVFLLTLSAVAVPSPAVFAENTADEIADDISDTQEKLEKEQRKADALNAELQGLASTISVVSRAIDQTQSVIESTAETIARKEAEIAKLEEDAARNRSILSRLLQEAYYREEELSLPEILAEEDMFRALNDPDRLLSFGERVGEVLVRIQTLRATIEDEKAELEGVKEEKEKLLEMKETQKEQLAVEHAETRSDLVEQEATVAELRAKLVEMQSDLAVLTGKAFDATDIREAVGFASDKTGVPDGVLYGFLKMETNLGANTGQCTYKQVKEDAIDIWYGTSSKWKASRDLLEKRQDLFYDLVDDLGYKKDKKVSCTPRSYRGQGGAMGVPQFMSDVWNGYRSRISAATGHGTPDPWNLTDGVMAMALKLKAAGATSTKASVIKSASISYLGAFNTDYYEGIVYWSKNYKRLFD